MLESHTVAHELEATAVDTLHPCQREIFLPFTRRAHRCLYNVALAQTEALYLRLGHIHIVGAGKVVEIGRAQESIAFGHDFEHTGNLEDIIEVISRIILSLLVEAVLLVLLALVLLRLLRYLVRLRELYCSSGLRCIMLLVDMSLLALLRLVLLILLIRMVLFALRAGHELATLAAGKKFAETAVVARREVAFARFAVFACGRRFGRRRFFRIVCGNSFGLRGSFSAGVRCCLVRFFGIRRGIIGNYGSVTVGSHRSLDSLCLRLFGHFLLWRTSAAFFLYHRGGIFRGSRIGLGSIAGGSRCFFHLHGGSLVTVVYGLFFLSSAFAGQFIRSFLLAGVGFAATTRRHGGFCHRLLVENAEHKFVASGQIYFFQAKSFCNRFQLFVGHGIKF